MTFDVVIVGAGHGGAACAVALRQTGFEGSIALVGDEPDPPYERPPLSKEYLAGTRAFERMLIRPASFWADRDIALILGTRVTAVDAAARVLLTDGGEAIGYGSLVWAAGGAPRRLPCHDGRVAGVHAIRTRVDVDALVGELPDVARVAVIGGGYVGLEAAAALVAQGKAVTLLEAQDRVLARVAGEPLSRFYEREHRARGVDVRLGVTVAALEGVGRVAGVRLADRGVVPADAVIVGIGIDPAVAPLRAAGAAGANGVDVDEACRTSLPHVWAIGDCAAHANRFADGARIRLESVQNANDQAAVAARAIQGHAAAYDATPWFWSNQYDLKLQTVGLSAGADAVVVRGDPDARRFSLVYLRRGRVVALDCVNSVADYVAGRKLVEARATVPEAVLSDASVPLKQALA